MSRYPKRYNSGTYILRVTNSHRVGLKACLIGETLARSQNPSLVPMAGEAMDPREESATATFLKQYNF